MTQEVQRWVAGVEYNGALFKGWQRQKHHPGLSVQDALENALSKVANHPVSIVCAGRTDSGVHASSQVIHFDTTALRTERSWKLGVNTGLPHGVCLNWVQPAPELDVSQVADAREGQFHARFSAVARRYRYFILNKPVKPGLMHDQATWWRVPLDANKMHEAAQALIGKHDFSSFRASDCQANNAVRTMKDISVTRINEWVIIEVCANAFLYHMVRNIAGVLLPIGEGRKPVEWCREVLLQQDRTKAGVTAPGEGLYFVDVEYPEFPDLPIENDGPYFYQLLKERTR
jgi:tRNA pseudouridine38-40 synthase